MKQARDPLFVALCKCLHDQRLACKDVAVYACLLNHVRGHTSRPSRVRIAQEACVNRINVTRHTRRLSEFGYIKVTQSKGKHTNIYEIEAMRRRETAPDAGVIPATVEPDNYLGITDDTQLKALRAPAAMPRAWAGKSAIRSRAVAPSKGANRPGAET